MSDDVRIDWNNFGFEALRREEAIDDFMLEQAVKIKDKTDPKLGYLAEPGHGIRRDRAAVIAATGAAKNDNASNHTLLKALGEVLAE